MKPGKGKNIDAPENAPAAPVPNFGDEMSDGSIFAGISPETSKPLYVTPSDASKTMDFNSATEYASKLDAHGHKDWRLPTKAELNVLFNNRAAIGGFNVTGAHPGGHNMTGTLTGWYWSSAHGGGRGKRGHGGRAWGQRFVDGLQMNNDQGHPSSVRPVR